MVTTEEFRGTERFTLRRCLGSGSFGKVYEVYDRDRNARVALKLPHAFKAMDLLRLKQEFRSLADISHPNLAELHELMTEDGHWFFTMELVEGKDFFRALRDEGEAYPDAGTAMHGEEGASPQTYSTIQALASSSGFSGGSSGNTFQYAKTYPCSPPKDFDRIRQAVVDLVHGLSALHEAGIVHRDLKPSNVIITPQGRLVILDFGLATHLVEGQDRDGLAGTPAFIAPEQLEGGACMPAGDWYSLGIMLYQVLTGQPPYIGTYLDIIRAKAEMDPCPPSLLVEGLPEDLEGLCMALMERDPAKRPSASEILSCLAKPGKGPNHEVRHLSLREAPGRDSELGLLFEEFQRLQNSAPRTIWLHGESGSGKSGLVQRFLKELHRREPSALILVGRCYEQETVPFKALDSLVDVLSSRLKGLPPAACKDLMPRHMQALVRLFPVLGQVPCIAELPPVKAFPDAVELRRRAFAAFRDLMGRLAKLHPLVLVLEDLQWGDLDSAALLMELFRPPEAPELMLIITFRSDERSSSPILRQLCAAPSDVFGTVTEIELRSLAFDASKASALAFLEEAGSEKEQLAEWVAKESGGNPFFIRELAAFLLQGQEGAVGDGNGLDRYIWERVQRIPEDARELLEVVALAGCPIPWGVARNAMGGDHDGGYHGFSQLRGFRLLRVRGSEDGKLLEPYHDRIRQAVVAGMDPDRIQQGSLDLGLAMETHGGMDSSLLAFHFKAGGAFDKSAHYFEIAGAQAEEALAFDHAANLYGEALALLAEPYANHRSLVLRYADALCNAGRSAEAAEVFLQLIPGGIGKERLFLQRRASEEFMRSGHMDRGVALLEGLLPMVGIRIPRTPVHALLSVLYWRGLLKLRGFSFRIKPEAEVSEELLQRIDILWAGAMGFGPVNPIQGAGFQIRQFFLSLQAGEPFRLARALAHEAVFRSLGGLRTERETGHIVALALSLAERMNHPNLMGRAFIGAGIAAIMQGRWKAGAELLDKAELLLKEHCTGLAYEIHIAQFQALVGYSVMGDLPTLLHRLPELIQEAKGEGDLLALTNLKTGYAYLLHLAQDEPDRAREVLHEAMGLWSKHAYHAQHYNAFISSVSIELYDGAFRDAMDHLERDWDRLQRSMLTQVQAIAITSRELRARTILGMALSCPGEAFPRQLQRARADIRRIEREKTPYGGALALRLRALLALAEGRTEEAQGGLLQAEVAFEACDMLLHAATARYGRATLQGDAGRELLKSAEATMREKGIQNPANFTRMHLTF